MMGFQYIQYLFLLAAVPLLVALFLFVLNRKKKTIKKIGDERLVKALIKNYSPAKFSFYLYWRLFSGFLHWPIYELQGELKK
jgi:hypothetical protein